MRPFLGVVLAFVTTVAAAAHILLADAGASSAVTWTPLGVGIALAPALVWYARSDKETIKQLRLDLAASYADLRACDAEKLEIYKQVGPLVSDVSHLGEQLLATSQAAVDEQKIAARVAAELERRQAGG